jgi:glucosamine-6-phosphate deaminase
MPMLAMTMGVGTILEAKKLVMLVTGAEKADIIAKAIEGPVTSMISGSAIQFHPDCVVILDEEAAAKLEGKEDYAFAVKNSPKYEDFL